jgi:hypothetical protein
MLKFQLISTHQRSMVLQTLKEEFESILNFFQKLIFFLRLEKV